MKKALFVIDVQNYFINTKTKTLPKKIQQYIEKNHRRFDLIIFTHFVNDPGSSVYRLLGWKDCTNPSQTDIAPELQPVLKYGIVVSKNIYSALKVPEINSLLKRYKIKTLFLCGIDTDCCLLATAYDAFDRGYKIYLLEDLCMASAGINLHHAALSIFKRNLLK